jgi:hypothetical protein
MNHLGRPISPMAKGDAQFAIFLRILFFLVRLP